MSKKTGYLFGILLTIIIGMLLMWYFCCRGEVQAAVADDDTTSTLDNQEVVAATPAATTMGFNLKDPDGNFAFSSNDNFNFNISKFAILKPVSGAVDDGIGKLQDYLSQDGNTGKFVDITGFYDTDEDNNSAFPNLGIARANAVKNYFVGKGIPSAQINTYGELKDALVPDGTIYKGPLQYTMGTTAANDSGVDKAAADLATLKARINENPLVLYFGNAQSTISLNAEQRQKIADISRYLDKVEGSSITIVGHTDNTGSRTTNTRLGLNRANFAKSFFVNNGIATSKINTSSKGPDEPIATNNTEEGKAKNRRCVVTLN